jgi:hypothetical protein
MKGDGLFQTVEEIRRARFSRLDPALVAEILNWQIQFQEDRTEAQRRTARTIAAWASANAGGRTS